MLGTSAVLLRPLGARAPCNLLDLDAFKEYAYMSFVVAGFIIFAGVLVPTFLVVSFATVALTAPRDLSFYMLSLLNAAQFFGRIIPAILSDWVGPKVLLLSAEVVAGILAFLWIAVDSVAGFVVWILAFGFVSGTIVTLPAAVLPFLCPSMSVLGTRLGMLYAFAALGFLFSTPVALSITSSSASSRKFLGPQVWVGACCLVASLFFAVAAREVWQKRRLYEQNFMHSSQYLLRGRSLGKV